MLMGNRIQVVPLVICISVMSCNRATQPSGAVSAVAKAPTSDDETGAQHNKPDNGLTYFLLEGNLIEPIKEKGLFKSDSLSFRYTQGGERVAEETFKSDKEAVNAAKKWLTEHFGKLDASSRLAVITIQGSSSGRDTPVYEWDFGHTITFRQEYNGIPTSGGAVVYITGTSQYSATIYLLEFRPIGAKSTKIVSKEYAIDVWRKKLMEEGYSGKRVDEIVSRLKPKLIYSWSPFHGRELEKDVFAPTWVLDDEEVVMVDGITGKPWFND